MSNKGTTKFKPNCVSTALRPWIFRKSCVFPELSVSLVSTILLCSASSALAHTGFTVVAPFSKTPPIFNAAPRSPRGSPHGCDTPTGYAGANFLRIDATVSVFVVYTDTDVFFCFSGVNRTDASSAAGPDPGTRVGVQFDVLHAGSGALPGNRYVFDIFPAGSVGATGHAMNALADPIPASGGPPGLPPATWSVKGADAPIEESLAWNAELRLSKSLLMGYVRCSPKKTTRGGFCGVREWSTVGVRFGFVNAKHNDSAAWPSLSIPSDAGTWGDLLFREPSVPKPTGVLTNLNDNSRTGSYFDSMLSPATLGNFGKVNTWELRGEPYAQLLYVHGLSLPNGTTRNVVFAATEENYVYAFDANPPFKPVWTQQLGPAVPTRNFPCEGTDNNLSPWNGITSTPVIDLDSNTIYVVAVTNESGNLYKLHALDLATGHEKSPGPIIIGDFVPGTANGNNNGLIKFTGDIHLNRPGLLLSRGMVYVAFGSHCDKSDYHGWVFAFDARTLSQAGVFITTPNGPQGGIWQAGRGLVADPAGNILFMTGNGHVATNTRGLRTDFGQSFVRLTPDLHVSDWWTVPEHTCFNQKGVDLDLGASGPLLFIHPSRELRNNTIVGGGKDGRFYLLNAMDLGHDNPNVEKIVATQEPHFLGFSPGTGTCPSALDGLDHHTHHIHGGPVLWDQSARGGEMLIYNMGEEEHLKAFRVINGATKLVGPTAISKFRAPQESMPGGILSLSHSDAPNSGLVWVLHPAQDDANFKIVEGMLSVFDATPAVCLGGGCTPSVMDLRLLWHSKLNSARDDVGLFAKFAPATIADGKVFVPSFGAAVPGSPQDSCPGDPPQTRAQDVKHYCPGRAGWLHEYGLLSGTR